MHSVQPEHQQEHPPVASVEASSCTSGEAIEESSCRSCTICGLDGKDFCCVPCNSYIHPFCNAFRHWLRTGFVETSSASHVDAQTKDFLAFRFVELLGTKKSHDHHYCECSNDRELMELLKLATLESKHDSLSLFHKLVQEYDCFSTYAFYNRPESCEVSTPPSRKEKKHFSNIVAIRSKFEIVAIHLDDADRLPWIGHHIIERVLADDELASVFISGLESQRSDPEERLSSSANMMWDIFSSYHQEYLAETAGRIMELVHGGDDQAALRKWLGANWYCDESFNGFRQDLRTQVMLDFFSESCSWCQGSANVVCAILGGISEWHRVRDHMNEAVRTFRHDPDLQVSLGSTQKELEHLSHAIFNGGSVLAAGDISEQASTFESEKLKVSAVLLYIEFDAWYKREDYDSFTWERTYRHGLDKGKGHDAAQEAADAKIKKRPGKHIGVSDCGKYVSNGGHVFVLECDAQRESFILYSSWREQYSLGEWMAQDVDKCDLAEEKLPTWPTKKYRMDASEMHTWLGHFGGLMRGGILGPTTSRCMSCCFGLRSMSAEKQQGFLEEVWDIGQMRDALTDCTDPACCGDVEDDQNKVLLWELHAYAVPFKDDVCVSNMKDLYDICDGAWDRANELLADMAEEMMDKMDVLQWELLSSEHFGRRCPRFRDDANFVKIAALHECDSE